MESKPMVCRAYKEAMPDINWNHPCPHWEESPENVAMLKADVKRLTDVAHWAQAVLTALNVGDVASGSPLHLKLREVMVAYRAAQAAERSEG